MTLEAPPIYDLLSDDQGKATLRWTLFFNQMYDGDAGTEWTPTFTGLGATGTPTITGRYYQLSQYVTFFRITITPGTDTTSTAGSTYCDNFPLLAANDGLCASVAGTVGGSLGIVDASTNRIYTPAWSAVTVPVTVLGIVEAG